MVQPREGGGTGTYCKIKLKLISGTLGKHCLQNGSSLLSPIGWN